MIAGVMPEKRQSASAWGRQSGNCRVAKAAKQKIDVKGWGLGGCKALAWGSSAPLRSSAARAALRGASPLPHLLQRAMA